MTRCSNDIVTLILLFSLQLCINEFARFFSNSYLLKQRKVNISQTCKIYLSNTHSNINLLLMLTLNYVNHKIQQLRNIILIIITINYYVNAKW